MFIAWAKGLRRDKDGKDGKLLCLQKKWKGEQYLFPALCFLFPRSLAIHSSFIIVQRPAKDRPSAELNPRSEALLRKCPTTLSTSCARPLSLGRNGDPLFAGSPTGNCASLPVAAIQSINGHRCKMYGKA